MKNYSKKLYIISRTFPNQLSSKEIEEYFKGNSSISEEKVIMSCLKMVANIACNTTCVYSCDDEDIFMNIFFKLSKIIDGFNPNYNLIDKRTIDQTFYSYMNACIKMEIKSNYIRPYHTYKNHFIETTLETAVYKNDDGEEITLGDTIAGKDINFDEIIDKKNLSKALSYSLNLLSNDERYIIINLFELTREPKKSQTTIGEELGKTQKQISRMKIEALAKLKNYLKCFGITKEDYLEENSKTYKK